MVEGATVGGHTPIWSRREHRERRVTTIAITGVSGLVGRRLVQALEQRPEVTRIVGLDRTAPDGLTGPRFTYRPADVRDPDLDAALSGVDVLVHLAFQLDPIHDEALMRAVNVDGTINVMEAAERAGVGHVVYPSSVVAYGAYADNDLPLTEDSPVRGTPELNYSEHKRDVEYWLADWVAGDHATEVCVLRLALVMGPGVQNFVTRILEGPRFTAVRDYTPPLQFVHLDDVVAAFEHAIEQRLTGVYNVAAEGWLSFDEILELVDRRVVSIPEELAFTTAERLWKLGIGEYPAGVVAHLMHPCVMSPAKLVATGWQPKVTNREALQETVREHQDYVAVAGVRTRRSTLRRATAVTGLAASAAVVLAWRRWRGRSAAAHAHAVHADVRESSGSASD